MSMGTSYFIRKVREMTNLLVTLLLRIISSMNLRQHRTDQQIVNEADDDHSKKKTTPVPMPMAYLPQEIMVKVLLGLPVKSLVRFRCVSKWWLSLISDRHFIKNHLRISDVNQRVIFINGKLDFSRHRTCSLDSMFSHLHNNNNTLTLDTLEEEFEEFDWKEPFPFQFGWLIGSYHGLVCLHSGDSRNHSSSSIVIWNPSLGEYKKLPPMLNSVDLSKEDALYGFGYDCSIDDYKVVVLLNLYEGFFFHTRAYVFTMTTNSWRRIQDYPYCTTNERSGRFICGALHWFSTDPCTKDYVEPLSRWCPRPSIIAFDLATETFAVVGQPSYSYQEQEECRISWDPQVVLGELGGCLCLMIDNEVQMRKDLWIMREYGVPNSWTKLASLPYLRRPSDHRYSSYNPNAITLFVLKTGELLVIYDYVICLYSSKDGEFRLLLAEKIIDNCLESAIYIESLVSPNAVNSVERIHQ